MRLSYRTHWQALSALHGTTATVHAMTWAYVATAAVTDGPLLADLPPGSESTADGYEPAEVELVWDDATDTLAIDPENTTHDLSDETNLGGWVIVADDGTLVALLSTPEPVSGASGWVFAPVDGIVAYGGDGASLDARITAVDARTPTAGGTTGQVWTKQSDDPLDGAWQTLTGDGGSVPTGGLLVPVVDGIADLHAADPAASYYLIYEPGMTVHLPDPDVSPRLSLTVADFGAGLGMPTFTIENKPTGAVSQVTAPDMTGTGFTLYLEPGAPEFAGFSDWGFAGLPPALIATSPDTTRWQLTVSDAGVVAATAL